MTGAATSVKSVKRSRLVLAGYWLALAIATHWPRLELPGPTSVIWQVDKILHVIAFAILTLLLLSARLPRRSAPRPARVIFATLIACGYALIDEWSQRYVGRVISAADLTASLCGVLSITVLALTPRRGPDEAGWPTIIIRAIVLLCLPTFLLIAALPAGNDTVLWLIGLYTRPWYGIDKPGHFWVGMILTWVLAATAPAGVRRPRLGAAITIAALGLGAPILEEVQARTGRGVEVRDVYMHNLGLLAALAGWSLLLATKSMIRPSPVSAESTDPDHPSRFVGHAVLVSGLTLVSRVTGLLRDAVLAAVFGASTLLDAFFIGFLVPNLFRRLFGEGALTAAFIPRYTRLLRQDPQLAGRFAALCIAVLVVLLAALTLIGEAVLIAWRYGLAPSQKTAAALNLTMIMLPYMPMVCLVAFLGAMLQVRRRFGPAAAAPIVLNLCLIVAAALAAGLGGRESIAPVAWAVLAAGIIQMIWLGIATLRTGGLVRDFTGAGRDFRGMVLIMVPMFLGLAVFQINVLFDGLIAFAFSPPEGHVGPITLFGFTFEPPIQAGAVVTLNLAQRLYQFPLGVFGIAIATAIFPALSAAAQDETDDRFATILRHGLRLTIFIGLPASIGLILVRQPLARVMFEHGAFTKDAALRVANILAGYAAAVWAYSTAHVLTRTFYARDDAITPVKISAAMVALNLALNLTLIWKLGAAGLAWSSAICAVGQVAMLLLLVRKHVEQPIDASVLAGWGRAVVLTSVMAATVWALLRWLDPASMSLWGAGAALAAAVALGGAIIVGGAWITGAEELTWLRRR